MRAARVGSLVLCVALGACGHAPTRGAVRPSGSSTLITAQDIREFPGQSLEQILMARVPGLTVTRSEGRTIVRLRGSTTFLGDEEPLFVVDGVALGPNAGGNLTAINPLDIELIEVLRDAAATAAYGVRGSNGVIIIKTKQP